MTTRVLRGAWPAVQMALWILVVTLAVLLVLPRFTSVDILIVRGGSMEPAIHLGSIEVVNRGDRTPVVGAVGVFQDQGSGPVSHRIVAVDAGLIQTKGDANAAPDLTPRSPDSMIGTVLFSIPYLGYVLHVLELPFVFFFLLLSTGGMIVAGEVRTIWREVRKLRSDRRQAASDESGDA